MFRSLLSGRFGTVGRKADPSRKSGGWAEAVSSMRPGGPSSLESEVAETVGPESQQGDFVTSLSEDSDPGVSLPGQNFRRQGPRAGAFRWISRRERDARGSQVCPLHDEV